MSFIEINGRRIAKGHPAYIIAEMSANHNQDFAKAVRIIEAAQKAGADAIKLQTYTPDTITIDCDNEYFKIQGTIWAGKNLYQLYGEAFTPWEWQPKLKEVADKLKIDIFSTPFDSSAVDFLEKMNVPAYKVASFENVDIPLLEKIACTGKPIIMSTGMATLGEIDEAVRTIRQAMNNQLALLKCTSAYPAPPEEVNLKTINHLSEAFDVPTGLSDHTMGSAVAVGAVTLGACIVEKHFTLSRKDPGPDSAFSMEPHEFKTMVEDIRTIEKALGKVCYGITEKQRESRAFRRSLFVVEDVKVAEEFTQTNVRSIRPGNGLHTRYLTKIIGKKAATNIAGGTPLSWDLLG
ncbi:MAG: pseudaminic acid synthase [Desulfobacteraceae bacterium]|nr:pseudaminic acid synthase [Desulfobacteraceae bacterium]